MKLRPYQLAAKQLIINAYQDGKLAPCLVAPTGYGKTAQAADICISAVSKGKRVLFLTPRRNLVLQTERAFIKSGIDCGVVMAGIEYNPDHAVTVASIDTVVSQLKKSYRTNAENAIRLAALVIVDEAHQYVAKARSTLLNAILAGEYSKYGEQKRLLHLTATPCVSGGGGLGAISDQLVISAGIKELITDGYLLQPHYYSAPKPDLSSVGMSAGDYKQNQLGDAYSDVKIVGNVVKNWHRIAYGTTTVVFTPTRANAMDLVHEFISSGVTAAYLDAKTSDDDRQIVFDGLADGSILVVCQVGIISLGTDIPRLQTVCMATATKSIAKWCQAVGRSLRPYPGQEHANIIDHGGMCLDPAMGPVEEIGDWSLEEKEKIQDRIEQRKKDNKELKDIECSKCHRTYKAAHTCPFCGFKRKQKSEQLEYHEADLKRIKSSSLTKEDKQKIWNDALWVAKYRNSKVGAASHIYRQKVGCWPKGLDRLPKGPQWQMSAAEFLAATR